MDDILHPFTNSFVLIFFNIILIFGKLLEEHINHIQQVLGTLHWHKLYANIETFLINMKRSYYLRYIMDRDGVHVDPMKI